MTLELILFIVALVPALLRTLAGWQRGGAIEVREFFVTLFAVLAALRYWRPASDLIIGTLHTQPGISAAIAFLGLFLAAAALAAFAIHLGGKRFQSVQENRPDQVIGALLGLISGALLGGSLLLVTTIALSGGSFRLDPTSLPARLDRFPLAVFRLCEEKVARIPADSPTSTSLPSVGPPDAERKGPVWD